MVTSRRSFLTGLGNLIAAPALVSATNLMPLRGVKLILPPTFEIAKAYVVHAPHMGIVATVHFDCEETFRKVERGESLWKLGLPTSKDVYERDYSTISYLVTP